jgi:hypothetical protein
MLHAHAQDMVNQTFNVIETVAGTNIIRMNPANSRQFLTLNNNYSMGLWFQPQGVVGQVDKPIVFIGNWTTTNGADSRQRVVRISLVRDQNNNLSIQSSFESPSGANARATLCL